MKRAATKAESLHMDLIASFPCVVCGQPGPSIVHHIREGQGMSQRAAHFLTLPLCHEDHVGSGGIHGDRSNWRLRKLDELSALAQVNRWVEEALR
jgi:hypothetical protein